MYTYSSTVGAHRDAWAHTASYCTLTYTHTHTHIHTLTHILIYAHIHTHTLVHTQTDTLTHTTQSLGQISFVQIHTTCRQTLYKDAHRHRDMHTT